MLRTKKGQSTLEYVIVLAAIVAVVVAFIGTNFQKDPTKGLGKLFQKCKETIETQTDKLTDLGGGEEGGEEGGGGEGGGS